MLSQHRGDDFLGCRCISRRFTQSVPDNLADLLQPASLYTRWDPFTYKFVV